MTVLEKKAIQTFNILWDNWVNPTQGSIQQSINTWADDCKGFGTALTEVWRGKKDFRVYSEEGFQRDPSGFILETKWMETDLISKDLVTLWGEFKIIIQLPVKEIILDPIRITALFREIDGEVKMIQFHSSDPDVSGQEEFWAGTGDPKVYDNVSILFTDFVGFTNAVSTLAPKLLISELNELFAGFDGIVKKNNLVKIKTIGDAYMAAGGLDNQDDHAVQAIRTAKQMLDFIKNRNHKSSIKWNMRIGIHSGEVVGGIIGTENLVFDLWGNTVNLASRMESTGESNRINISQETFELVKHKYACDHRGKILTKENKEIDMYFVE